MANKMISVVPMLMLMGIEVVLVVVFVYAYAASFRYLYKPYNMILVFGNENAVTLKLKMDTRRDKYQINKLISIEKGFDAVYGARPLRREIQNKIEDALSEKILDASIKNGDNVICNYDNGEFTFTVK